MITKENMPKVSVVIPIYNCENFVFDCINSIIDQTYTNLEIICVNDASTDNGMFKIKELIDNDKRIKVVNNEVNKGLFHTRIEGSKVATGEYICFVDSDDTISVDWIRLLVEKAETEKADMVMGNTVQIRDNEYFIDNYYRSHNFDHESIEGDEVFQFFMEDEGLNFTWHTVWNKIYSMKLWEKAFDDFKAIKSHLIMCEDVAFSLVLYYYCKKLAFSNHDAYFYYRHDQAATSVSISKERVKKNIMDSALVFDFFKDFLVKKNIYAQYEEKFNNYRNRNFRFFCNLLDVRGFSKDKELVKLLLDGFKQKKLVLAKSGDFYFHEITTQYQHNFAYDNDIKRKISSAKYDIISFDLFDTLAVRPFGTPDKLFDFIENKYASFFLSENINNFKSKRIEAENYCRRLNRLDNRSIEDCKLNEVYTTFSQIFDVPLETALKIKEFEEQTDLELLRPRLYGKELWNLARFIGKKRIIITDTYYDEPVIKKILDKIGIAGYDNLFISSEVYKLKATGSLFNHVKKTMQINGENILHLGDNYSNDIIQATNAGIDSMFLGSTSEIFLNLHPGDNYVGPIHPKNLISAHSQIDIECALNQISMNAAVAMVGNNIFDKAYPSWNKELIYNADPYFVGNYVLGTEMLGVASKLVQICQEFGYDKVVFLARDGYLPKKAFDIIVNKRNLNLKSSYFYASRRSLLRFVLCKNQNINDLRSNINITEHSPQSILELFDEYIKDKDALEHQLKENKIFLNENFKSELNFANFAQISNHFIDFSKLKTHNDIIASEIKHEFAGNCLTFDLGYSGKIQRILTEVVGKPLDVFFVHSNGVESKILAEQSGFKIYEYLAYSPKISAVIREYFFSEPINACCGYEIIDNGKIKNQFDKCESNPIELFIFKEMERGMVKFIKDYSEMFSKYPFMFEFRSNEISIPFELFINQNTKRDIYMFRMSYTEDVMFSNYNKKSIYELWQQLFEEKFLVTNEPNNEDNKTVVSYFNNSSMSIFNLDEFKKLPRYKRAIVTRLVDKQRFKAKLKKAFGKNKNKRKNK